jgi:hypothetical protein
MSDLDNYKSMLEGSPGVGTFLTHFWFIVVVRLLGGFSALVWFVPLLLGVNLVLIYWVWRGVGFHGRVCFWGVVWFVFGSFYFFFFGFTGLLNQLFSLVWVLLACGCLVRGKIRVGVYLELFSCLVHYLNVGFWFLVVVSELMFRKRDYELILCGFFAFFFVMLGGYRFFVPFSFYPVEPPLYLMWALYTCPVVWVYLFFSELGVSRYRFLAGCLFAASPFFHLGRFMVFLHILVMPWAYQGYKNVKRMVFFPRLFVAFNVLFFLLYIDYGLSFAWDSLVKEGVFRGLAITHKFLYPLD